ncbi:MAG: hypothetical protein ABGY42_04020 [bacterium]
MAGALAGLWAHVLVGYAPGAAHLEVTDILGDEGKCVCRVVHEIKTTAKEKAGINLSPSLRN